MKRKILILGTSDFGGVTNYVSSYVKRIIDFEFIVSFDENMNKQAIKALFPKAKLTKIPQKYSGLTLLKSLIFLNRTVKTNKVRIIHAHTIRAGFLAALYKLIANRKIKLIYTGHGLRYTEKTNTLNKFIFKLIEKITNQISDRIIFIRELDFQLAENEKLVPSTKSVYIRTQLSRENIKSNNIDIRSKFKITTPYVIANAASIYDIKNPDLFVQIAQIIIDIRKDITFLWLGEGKTREKIVKRIEQLGLSRNIHFPGALDSQLMFNAFQQINGLLITSKTEVFPLVILEAYLTNTLVFSSNFIGVNEIIKNNQTGFIFDMHNPADAAKCILDAFSDLDNLENIVKTGKIFFEDSFNNMDQFVKQHAQLYKLTLR